MSDVTDSFDFTEDVGDWTAGAGRGDDIYLSPEDLKVPDGVPEPCLWRLLVMPIQPRTKSKGGIALPEMAREAEAHLNYIGKVIGMGPLAGKSEKFLVDGKSCYNVKAGDWVIFGRYAGQKCTYKDVQFLFINDDEVLGVAKSPDGFRIYT